MGDDFNIYIGSIGNEMGIKRILRDRAGRGEYGRFLWVI